MCNHFFTVNVCENIEAISKTASISREGVLGVAHAVLRQFSLNIEMLRKREPWFNSGAPFDTVFTGQKIITVPLIHILFSTHNGDIQVVRQVMFDY